MKIPIWKQFTTTWRSVGPRFMLWLSYEDTNLKAIHNTYAHLLKKLFAVIILWRYQFESNSQRKERCIRTLVSCDYPMKIPIWKQFTTVLNQTPKCYGCDYPMKIPIWKQFTTKRGRSYQVSLLWLSYEDTNITMLWLSYEDTNLKAIHKCLISWFCDHPIPQWFPLFHHLFNNCGNFFIIWFYKQTCMSTFYFDYIYRSGKGLPSKKFWFEEIISSNFGS